ncbi:hypothetical protein [Myxosarcina sp. GI1]|uniref:hypothetical protein n=1 Tax=Myxosarcina sp. GI1 TaxID=1541065 RepID=UPI000563F911|nr:hypothetical protein [Myxosarcina sp. GI1]
MNKIALFILAGTLALFTESCSYLSDFAALRKETEDNEIDPASITIAPDEDLMVAEEDEVTEPNDNIAGLIPATNANVRVKSVVRGRQDPFSALNLQPKVEFEEEEVVASDVGQPSEVPVFDPPEDMLADSSDDDFFEPPEEEFLEPTLAREVVVTGVVKVDGKDKIIVNAPEETSSRYVEVGQYLSNGQILVKDIDFNNPTPVVILEEFGTEVTKEVGESVTSEEDYLSRSLSDKLFGS